MAGSVRVVPLEWRKVDYWWADGKPTDRSYSIIEEDGKFWAGWDVSLPAFDTLDEAKSAAQADFERRILACLAPTDEDPTTPASDALRASLIERLYATEGHARIIDKDEEQPLTVLLRDVRRYLERNSDGD